MNFLTIGSFLLFTALVALITYFKTRGDKLDSSNDSYFLGGRSLTAGVIGGSLMLTNLNAANFVGMSAQAYTDNMSVMGWEVASGLTLVITALVLVPRYLKGGLTTVPDFLEERFDTGVKRAVTYLFLAGYVLNLLPTTLYAGSVAMSNFFNISGLFGVSYESGIWITVWTLGIIGSIYAIFGGLKAVAVSDALNGIGLIIGGLLVPFFGLKYLGNGEFMVGLGEMMTTSTEKLNAIGSTSDPVPFTTLFTGMLLVNLYYWGTDQAIIQRALGAKNLEEGQKGVVMAGFLKILTPLIVIIPGIIGFHIYGGSVENADAVYPMLVQDVLPKPLVGFFAAVMFGAILSTFNSVLNSATTLFALNVYKPIFGENKTDDQIVSKGQTFGTILAVGSMIIAPFIMYAPNGLFQYLQKVNGFFNVPIFTIILIGYLTKRVPAIAAKISLSVFVSAYAVLQLIIKPELHFLHQLAILFVVCAGLMIVIGKLKPRKEPYKLENKEVVDITPWKYRYEFSTFVVGVMVCFYLTFSKFGLVSQNYARLIKAISGVGIIVVGLITYFMMNKSSKAENEKVNSLEPESALD
mgnify:CR=1 FL=1